MNLNDFEVLRRALHLAHVTGHFHAAHNCAGKQALANGAGATMPAFGAVRRITAAESVPGHDTFKATALRHTDRINEIANREKAPFTISAATFDRIKNPAKGRHGGGSGVNGVARLGSGKAIPDKGIHVIPTGDSLVVELPGGGGFGNSMLRTRALVEADVRAGVVSPEAAKKDYFL